MSKRINNIRVGFHGPYAIMAMVYICFIIYAFIVDSPSHILDGLGRILKSPSILATDYIEIGGVGATLVNSAIVGFAGLVMLLSNKVKPNGAMIMAMWLTTGFAFFGKNFFNMFPLIIGVWLYSKYQKEPFINYTLAALLVSTLSPTVSNIAFLGVASPAVEITLGILFGFLIGFIFPVVSSATVRAHLGYNLYNMGFAGGIICTMIFSLLKSSGIHMTPVETFSSGNNAAIAAGLYMIAAGLFCYGYFVGGTKDKFREFLAIHKHSGRLVSDFFYEHGNSIYINMAVLCAFSTTSVLLLGADLNGPIIASIFTIMGFGSFGKHLRNVIPIMTGAILSSFIFGGMPGIHTCIIAILLSTGLAPIAGHFGAFWGIAAGFIHVNVNLHTAYLSGGMNLYSNGLSAGITAMFLVPIITAFRRKGASEDED
ncbi:MAG: DUF1576 domain-containing protein [Lachnospiraceae bacterium]|nr:DUF1576 domain-containing protein [Lachnospiraceae bacterium]